MCLCSAPMPDLDLEPKDYRAQPVKGEPIFRRGGLLFLVLFVVVVIVIAGLNGLFTDLVRSVLGPLLGDPRVN